MNRTTIFIAAIWGMGLATCHAGEDWPSIGQGINLDFATTQVNKVEYDPGFYEAFQAAGFDSVRFFVKTGVTEPEQVKAAIDDALERGLTVVLAGFTSKHHGKDRFVEFWRGFAEFYRMYPKELVFEIMNEPSQGGHPNNERSATMTMDWLGAAIVAVRDSSPTRVIAIGGPGYNPADTLLKYVTPEYLDYQLPDGTGFEDDENIWGIFHNYEPHKWSHSKETISLATASPRWAEEVIGKLDKAAAWSEKHNKKVLLSEWGARLHSTPKDVEAYIQLMVEETARRKIDWMYYCGVFNNAWPFSLYTSESGWEESARYVELLTGTYPTQMAPTNQINNPSFLMDTGHWYADDQVTLGTADHEGVGGSRALRCMVAFTRPRVPSVYQQSNPNWRFKSEGRYLLQLRRGNTYHISFHAKSTYGPTTLRVQLGHAPDNEPLVWTSEPVVINEELLEYEMTYKHESESVENARFSILFSEQHSEIILDDITLRSTRPGQ